VRMPCSARSLHERSDIWFTHAHPGFAIARRKTRVSAL
jgi:hypothetical protein